MPYDLKKGPNRTVLSTEFPWYRKQDLGNLKIALAFADIWEALSVCLEGNRRRLTDTGFET